MQRIIRINEEQYNTIKEEYKMTELKFYTAIRTLLKSIMVKPLSFTFPTILQVNGLNKERLIKILLDQKIIIKKEELIDKDVDGNFIKPKMNISYLVPKTNFELKLRKLYTTLFDENDSLIECDCSGATGADSAGSFVGPLNANPILRRKLKTNF